VRPDPDADRDTDRDADRDANGNADRDTDADTDTDACDDNAVCSTIGDGGRDGWDESCDGYKDRSDDRYNFGNGIVNDWRHGNPRTGMRTRIGCRSSDDRTCGVDVWPGRDEQDLPGRCPMQRCAV
jgi:hypothetical protein